jgi:hypothetical protein
MDGPRGSQDDGANIVVLLTVGPPLDPRDQTRTRFYGEASRSLKRKLQEIDLNGPAQQEATVMPEGGPVQFPADIDLPDFPPVEELPVAEYNGYVRNSFPSIRQLATDTVNSVFCFFHCLFVLE